MLQQTNNDPMQDVDTILPEGDQYTTLNSQSQNRVVNKGEETMIDDEDVIADEAMPGSSEEMSNEANSYEKNDLVFADDEEIEDEDYNSTDEETEEADIHNEEVDEESPEIVNDEEMGEEDSRMQED